jgi:aryl-alcohol dehydrogenase-like predicted oxidoreductase
MKIGIGTAQLGLNYGIANKSGKVNFLEAKRIFSIASNNNINVIDTANSYGDSEKILGKIGVNNFQIVTKLSEIPLNCGNVNKWVETEILTSLKKLQIKQLYCLLLHKPNQINSEFGEEIVNAINNLKELGLVKKVGVSIYSYKELPFLMNFKFIDLIQAPFNIIDQSLFTSGWMDKLYHKGIELHIRSIFLQGLLTLPRKKIPNEFKKWNMIFDTWDNFLIENQLNSTEVCYRFVKKFKQISKIIIGFDNALHLAELINIDTNKKSLSFPDIKCEDEVLINPSLWKI